MIRISTRELRLHASKWLQRVEAGETIEVTSRGRTVALLTPVPAGDVLSRLEDVGRLTVSAGDVLDLGPPLQPQRGQVLPSEALRQARETSR